MKTIEVPFVLGDKVRMIEGRQRGKLGFVGAIMVTPSGVYYTIDWKTPKEGEWPSSMSVPLRMLELAGN